MKKFLKVLLTIIIIIVVLAIILITILSIKNGIDAKKPYLSDDYYTSFKSDSLLEKKYSGLGDYEISNVDYAANDKKIEKYRVWYPKELENKEKVYPLIVITNASNVAALNYEPYFKRLASWGFIVIGNEDRQAGSGESTSLTLDYVLSLNEKQGNIFYHKISQENIGIIGFSQGGAGAIRAVSEFSNSNRYKTIFTGSAAYAKLAKNMGWEYDASKINIPYFMAAGTGKSDDSLKYGENDFSGVAPLFSLEENYEAMSDEVFKIRARIKDAEHEDMLTLTDGYMTAWMLWQLCDNDEAQKVFVGNEAEILSNTKWQDIKKRDD